MPNTLAMHDVRDLRQGNMTRDLKHCSINRVSGVTIENTDFFLNLSLK